MDSIGASIETEQRAKGEALRVKKQLEGEINELEIGLDHANKANSEGLSPLSVIKDNSEKLSSYLKMRPVQKPRLLSRLEYLSAKLHPFLEKLKRAKLFWMVLTVLNANSRETLLMHGAVNNMQTINGRDMTAKRQLESSIHTLQA